MDASDSCANLDAFYHQVGSVVADWDDKIITPTEKGVALLRIAFDAGVADLGATGVLHMFSKMMTITLEVLNENNEVTTVDLLREFEINCKQPN